MGYFSICILIIIYLFILILCHVFSKRLVITPEFIFTACFLPQLVFSLFYVKKWDLSISIDTLMVYCIGVLSFFVFSLVFRNLFFKRHTYESVGCSNRIISIKKWKLVVCIFFHVVAIFLMSKALMDATHSSNLTTAINIYAIVSKSYGMELSQIPAKMNLFSYLSGFVWIYYLVHSFVYQYKSNRLLIALNLGLSFISNFLTGSRGGVFQVILAGIFIYYLLWGEKNGWNKDIPIKSYIKIMLLVIVLLFTFQASLQLLGRASSKTIVSDYLATYLCAEIKNLDLSINNGLMNIRNVLEWSTLNRFLSKVTGLFGVEVQRTYADAGTYVYYKGISLGNVYTIYYSFISDLSFGGLVFFEAIMAFICQFSLYRAIKTRNNISSIQISKIVYAYMLSMLSFSFFSDWFFDNIFSTGFIWCLIVWGISKLFLENHILNVNIKSPTLD